MKRLSLLLTVFLISTGIAQWNVLNPHPTPNTSYVGSAPSVDRYITVTGQGEAVVTHDGGATWNIVQIGGEGIYRSVYFVNNNTGWAVGSFVERLHKSTDGGLTWTWQPNAPDTTKYDVFFIDENIGWSVGFNGFIIKTTNGGNDWFTQSNTALTTRTLYSVYSTDINNVFVAGNTDAFLKSTDGGDSWTAISPIYGTTTDFRGIYFPPTSTGMLGFAVGNRNRIVRTTDGGSAWTSVFEGGGTNQLWAIDFDDAGVNGIAVGAASTVLRSTNGGDSWVQVTGFPASQTFYSVRFGADNAAYISGSNGYFFKSTDGGATWNSLGYRFASSRIRDVSFADNNTGYVVGTGFIAKSTNGGNTWTQQISPFGGDINEVVARSPNFAVAGCDAGNIVRTTDGGDNWQLVPTGISGTNSDILAIDFINNNFGIVAAYNGNVATTTNGGLTWNIIGLISGSNPWDMDMVDSLYGYVAGTGERIYRTTDGGMSWSIQLAVGGLGTYGISFIDRDNGIAGGSSGNTFYTTNAGDTWNTAVTQPGNTIWGIHFTPSPVYGSVGMTACASGYVYISTDGGVNWVQEPRYTISTFDDIYMTDAANAWIVGNSGVILKYTNPANLPVELNTFTHSVNGNNVILKWSTASEINSNGYEVYRKKIEERSEESVWKLLGFVEGSGTTTEQKFYTFKDEQLSSGIYFYRIKQIDFDGTYKYYELTETVEITSPNKFELSQNYPNPFNPTTKIRYIIPDVISIPTSQERNLLVTLKVYDILGNEVAALVNEYKTSGSYEVGFSSDGLASGVYYYQLKAGAFVETKKMIILK